MSVHPRRYAACIFDLFGTLVALPKVQDDARHLTEIALALGLEPHIFNANWRKTTAQRFDGSFADIRASLYAVSVMSGVTPNDQQLAKALELRQEASRQTLRLVRTDAISTLQHLRTQGIQTALISDCSPNIPALWAETPLAPLIDYPIFSCAVRMRKPDPRIYVLACERLGIEATECLYIGDGGSDELNGATRAGMTAIQLSAPDDSDQSPFDYQAWAGPKISSLSEVLIIATKDY